MKRYIGTVQGLRRETVTLQSLLVFAASKVVSETLEPLKHSPVD